MRNIDLAAELGAQTYVFWGGREGASTTAPRTSGPRSTATARASTLLAQYVTDRGYDMRFAIEPKPNEPRGDILLPTVGHALAFIDELEHPEMVGLNPEVGHEQMSGLNFAHGIAQALWARQAVPHRPQRAARHQVRPGPGLRHETYQRVLPRSTCSSTAPRGAPPTTGPRHFDFKPSRTEDMAGVWASARRTWHLPPSSRSAPMPSGPTPRCRPRWKRPGVRDAAAADAGTEGESLGRPGSRTDRPSRTSTPMPSASSGFGFVRLNQLAREHPVGAW